MNDAAASPDHSTEPSPNAPGVGAWIRAGRSGPAAASAVLKHRWPTWLALIAAAVIFADGLPPVELAWILVSMPVIYLAFGAFRGELRRPGELALQAAGLLVFCSLALGALSVDRSLTLYLLAAGWLGHGLWDLAHHRAGRVVPRAWAEWCGVVDVIGATSILLWAFNAG